MNLLPHKYYKSDLVGFGECFIKALENKMLCVSSKPAAIFTMAGLITSNGSVQVTKEAFDTQFEQRKYELSVLKNS